MHTELSENCTVASLIYIYINKHTYIHTYKPIQCTQSRSTGELTSLVKVMLDLVVLAQHVAVPHVEPVVLVRFPVGQLDVKLVGRGVERVSARLVLVAVVVVQDGRLADGHADDGAAVLVVAAAGAAVAVAALRPQQHGGDVVDLVRGLGAGALLRDAAALAPSVAGVEDEGEEEDEEEERDEASLE